MKQHIRTIAPILLLAVVFAACGPGKPNTNPQATGPLHTVLQASNEASTTLNQLMDVKRDAFKAGTITKDQAHKFDLAVLKIAPNIKKVNSIGRTYATIDLASPELQPLAKQIKSDLVDLNSAGVFFVKNPQTQATVNNLINLIGTLIESILAAVA